MSKITPKLIKRRVQRANIKAKLKARPQVMHKGKLKKKGWPNN